MLGTRLTRQVSEILLAAGFIPEFHPAEWEDIGGPESGPKLCGHNDTIIYYRESDRYEIAFEDGIVVDCGHVPPYYDSDIPF